MAGILIKNGRIIDPVNRIDRVGDIGIVDGKLADPLSIVPDEVIDATGLIVAPGLMDIHVHLRDPGQTHKEDMATGTAAAAAGGFTTVVAMPNTIPAMDSVEHFELAQRLIAEKACIEVVQSACLSVNRKGEELTDFEALAKAGVLMLTDDGTCIQSHYKMWQALKKAAALNIPVSEHCEEEDLAAKGVMNDGQVSRELGLPGKSRLAEEMIVARDILLARESGAAVHIQHISSANSVKMIRAAQKEGIRITAEATPHHIMGTDEWVREFGPNAKMNPPLCTEEDRLEIIRGLADKTICCLVTDHAPHTDEEKGVGMLKAPAGIVGIEVALPLCLTELCERHHFSLYDVIALFTEGPRQVVSGLTGGTLSLGADANVVIFDATQRQKINCATFKSKSTNCPYDGMEVVGKICRTIYKGKTVYRGEN